MAREAYITGIGQSEVGVRLPRQPLLLTKDAIDEALADAGLTLSQIDGVFSFPGKSHGYTAFSPVGTDELIEALGIKSKLADGRDGAARAALGDRHGGAGREGRRMPPRDLLPHRLRGGRRCRDPGTYMSGDEAATPSRARRSGPRRSSRSRRRAGSRNTRMRHMHRYGMTREQLAHDRDQRQRNALLNPHARAITKEPLTLDKYMAARPITSPFCLYDCDRFTDGSTVLIVSAGDALDEVH